ncbi:MAG: hypothetical protein ACJAR8_001772 [Bacteroidia bacterium]|jgi:hypothetical protein
MQKPIWNNILLTLIFFTFCGCENELKVAADWEEVAVVYAALNPTQSKNYVRVQRAYLDEKRGALNFSNVQDSLYFEELDVTILEYRNETLTNTFILRKVDGDTLGMPKDTGVFYSDQNILYELDNPVMPSSYLVNYTYVITVRNPVTGYSTTASTPSVGSPEVTEPINDNFSLINFNGTNDQTTLTRFQEGKWARAYSVEMVIYVEETQKDNPANKEMKEIIWRMVNLGRTRGLQSQEKATYLVPSINFFTSLQAGLQEDNSVERRLINYDINFYGISDDFNTYLSVNEPSIGIIQKKPEYTNFDNGLGIFASRHIKSFEGYIFPGSTLRHIQESRFTEKLGFLP